MPDSNDDFDEFDDIPLPDLTQLDLAQYDTIVDPPPPPPPAKHIRPIKPKSASGDQNRWEDLPLRVDENGQYDIRRDASVGSPMEDPQQPPQPDLTDGISTANQVEEAELENLRRRVQELEASLATQTETVFTAKGEATVLRQTLEKQQESHSLALRNLMNQHADKMEKARKLEQQRKLEEEGRRAQSTFDNFAAVSFSAKRPQWPQSVSRSSVKNQASQPQWQQHQTPGPAARMAGRTYESQARNNQLVSQGSPALRNNKEKGKERERDHRVPKFQGFQNSFAPDSSLRVNGDHRTAKADAENLHAHSPSRKPTRSPSKAPPVFDLSQARDKRSVSPSSKRRRLSVPREEEPITEKDDYEWEGAGTQDNWQPPLLAVPPPQADGPSEEEGGLRQESQYAEEDSEEEDKIEEDEVPFRPTEHSILVRTIFSHLANPLSLEATAPPAPTIQLLLAPLPSGRSSSKDQTDHFRLCGRILSYLGSDSGTGREIEGCVRDLAGLCKLFERTSDIPNLTLTLKLLHSILLRIPRTARLLLQLPTFLAIIMAIKDARLPAPIPLLVKGSKREREQTVDLEEETKRTESVALLSGLLYVLEGCVAEAEDTDVDRLALIVQLPGFLLVILAPTSPIKVVLQAMRIVSALSLHEGLFHPLFSFPDEDPGAHLDLARVPLVELCFRYLREPHPQASTSQSLDLSLFILTTFHALCELHSNEATVILASSRSAIPTLAVILEQLASSVFGVEVEQALIRSSVPLLNPLLSLLSTLSASTNVADRLRAAPKSEPAFSAVLDRFMVAFARICFADPPELTGPGGPFEEEETEGKVWEAELERAGDSAREIFDSVVEGPEGDAVYIVMDSGGGDDEDMYDYDNEGLEGEHEDEDGVQELRNGGVDLGDVDIVVIDD